MWPETSSTPTISRHPFLHLPLSNCNYSKKISWNRWCINIIVPCTQWKRLDCTSLDGVSLNSNYQQTSFSNLQLSNCDLSKKILWNRWCIKIIVPFTQLGLHATQRAWTVPVLWMAFCFLRKSLIAYEVQSAVCVASQIIKLLNKQDRDI